tara:strand:+ start:32 stop:232 length:201 start_codon:yes stop_codon:yes gene_type:complete
MSQIPKIKKYYNKESEHVITEYDNGTHYEDNKRKGSDRRWNGIDRRQSSDRRNLVQLELFEPNDVY